jgi:hypothetical protein|tara:strand:- start:410 stop:742 length:333 start_codon:yes stop_codon:yes gene_type:complete
MKKLSVILVAFALLLGTNVTAAVAGLDKEKKVTISQEIGDLLTNADMELDYDVNADVTFTINGEGEIVVLTVDTMDSSIESFIKSRLNYKKLQNELIEGEEYKVPIIMKA